MPFWSKKKSKLGSAAGGKEALHPGRQALAEPVGNLEITVGTAALLSTEPILRWAESCGVTLDARTSFALRMEMVYFFLHMTDRYAFDESPAARAALLDRLVVGIIEKVIQSSFNTSKAEEGFDLKDWQERLLADCIDRYNESQVQFGACANVLDGTMSDTSVIGQLAARIEEVTSEDFTKLASPSLNHPFGAGADLQLQVMQATAKALATSNLKAGVAAACTALREKR